MKRPLLAAGAALLLTACNTTGGLVERVNKISAMNPHCKKDITLTAQIGPMNPASGAYLNVRVYDCLQTDPNTVGASAEPAAPDISSLVPPMAAELTE